MMKVGLTGGIGSGKSTVAKMFIELGIPVYDSDAQAKELMSHSKKLKKAIVQLLGKNAFKGEVLNRKYIAGKVFADPKLLEKLNKIVHPAVKEHFLDWTQKQDSEYVIQESALIFENGKEDFYDAVILVTAPEEIRVERVVKRDNSEASDVMQRIENQMKDREKEDKAHFHIENIDLETTQNKVLEIHNAIVKSSA
ncbi:dephospho-CoA kinase [Flagellimonas meridianipacifica]|uniref:Dephospho-CoA kinase n=1 Tax=Flagellimonas meridianipacifica TaxID=1080225 RepID=A0A2T0MAL0_9FLAO|nr:dephospho-CoA kinase [Allomuricauda pacifica]PRX54515.1 dephospho-CoA kinase [Allomuricauda pacifica]